MKKFALFLLLGLMANQLVIAQPVAGQKYLELRQFSLDRGNQINTAPFGSESRYFGFNTTFGMGKMYNDHYSAGILLSAGYLLNEQQNQLNQSIRFGLHVYGRRWYDLSNKFKLHADMQVGYQGEKPLMASALVGSDQLSLGLVPGLSWFVHPRWALQARIPFLSMNLWRNYSPISTVSRSSFDFNPNPFAPNWNITFWLK